MAAVVASRQLLVDWLFVWLGLRQAADAGLSAAGCQTPLHADVIICSRVVISSCPFIYGPTVNMSIILALITGGTRCCTAGLERGGGGGGGGRRRKEEEEEEEHIIFCQQ